MGRPRKFVDTMVSGDSLSQIQDDILAEVESGDYPREKLPALLALAKAHDDKPMIAAILKACGG